MTQLPPSQTADATSALVEEIKGLIDSLSGREQDNADWVKRGKHVDSFSRIPGDASTRRYYRVLAGEQSLIVMHMETFEKDGANVPFIVVQKHLAAAGVDVPQIIAIDPSRGLMVLEDLGDITLLRRLQEVSSSEVERNLYERVLDELVKLQLDASPARRPAQIDAYKLRFDHEKLMWEVNFAIDHFYKQHLKRRIRERDLKIMQEGFSDICGILAAQPTVLAHRDFHSRNIMVTGPLGKDERLVMIDFQDARMGPKEYDLASLLRDSYYQLEEVQIARLLDYYVARYQALSGQILDRQEFRYVFDLMSVQRNFKAIGSFASFLNRRGNPTYLKYIGNTFENIRRNLLKYPQYSALRETLFHYYYF